MFLIKLLNNFHVVSRSSSSVARNLPLAAAPSCVCYHFQKVQLLQQLGIVVPVPVTRNYSTTGASSSGIRGKPSAHEVRIGEQTIGTRRPTKNKNSPAAAAAASATAPMASSTSSPSPSPSQSTTTDKESKPVIKGKGETDDNIIWIDCEMTGLDLETDVLMEVACIITDPNLKEIGRQSNLVIHVPDQLLNSMDAWCMAHHGESGLTDKCRTSKLTAADAEKILLEFVQKHTEKGRCPIGGNSIYGDRAFLQKFMPTLYSHFHYRSIDVSSLKELTRRWYPKEYFSAPRKRFIHRTIEDIEDSIAELQFYRSVIFKK